MTKTSITHSGHPEAESHVSDARLEQALELCATSCLKQCFSATPERSPHPVWMRLYAASERLKRAVHDGDARQAILEISSNLIGCEEIAILELCDGPMLSLLAGCGLSSEHQEVLASQAEEIALAIGQDQITVAGADTAFEDLWSRLGITALVPIWHNRKPKGGIVLYGLLPQRNSLDASDYELLLLLSIFSGPLLFNHVAG